MAVRGPHHRIGTKLSVFVYVLTLYLVLHQTVLSHAEECPCGRCGPPMCAPMCQLNCVKCCTCCVYFEARIGKRMSSGRIHPYEKWETEGRLDINKREPNKEISLRLSILRKSEGRFEYLTQQQQKDKEGIQQLGFTPQQQQQYRSKGHTPHLQHRIAALETLHDMEIQDGDRFVKSPMVHADDETFSAAASAALSGRTAELPEIVLERMAGGEGMAQEGMANVK